MSMLLKDLPTEGSNGDALISIPTLAAQLNQDPRIFLVRINFADLPNRLTVP
jgi:hypothetical protein